MKGEKLSPNVWMMSDGNDESDYTNGGGGDPAVEDGNNEKNEDEKEDVMDVLPP